MLDAAIQAKKTTTTEDSSVGIVADTCGVGRRKRVARLKKLVPEPNLNRKKIHRESHQHFDSILGLN